MQFTLTNLKGKENEIIMNGDLVDLWMGILLNSETNSVWNSGNVSKVNYFNYFHGT